MKKKYFFIIFILITDFLFAERPIVQDIQTSVGNGRTINVSWTLPQLEDDKISELHIYRSKQQISAFSDLENSVPIAKIPGNFTSYQDSIDDFSDYFYAVIAVTNEPYKIIILSINSTIKGIHLNPKKQSSKEKKDDEEIYENGELRKTPLPYVSFIEGLNEEEIISDEIVNSTKSLTFSKEKKQNTLQPYIFEEDLISPDGGEEYILFEILKTYFATKKYEQAVLNLSRLIGTNISENTRNRSIFYIGESYYFLEKYDAAIMNFIKVKNTYPKESQIWIDSSLDKL